MNDRDEPAGPPYEARSIQLLEPTGGGGGIAIVDGRTIQLGPTQVELVRLLLERMTEDRDRDANMRGFVTRNEILDAVSWETREPNETHVRQIVARTQRALSRAMAGDLIESRAGTGYRLRLLPHVR